MFFKRSHKDVLIEEMIFSKSFAASHRIGSRALLLFLMANAPAQAEGRESALKAFVSNGCTAFANGPKNDPEQWAHCCVEHDLFFWAGGCPSFRLQADQRLRDCVSATGAPRIAWLMYLGVRIGSWSPIKIKEERWGNGWLDGRPDGQALSPGDLESLQAELRSHPYSGLNPETLQSFVSTLRDQIHSGSACDHSALNGVYSNRRFLRER